MLDAFAKTLLVLTGGERPAWIPGRNIELSAKHLA
jgi:hypothetical protein